MLYPFFNGGADRVRTDDLHNAIVALCQLSYGPKYDNYGRKSKRGQVQSIPNKGIMQRVASSEAE